MEDFVVCNIDFEDERLHTLIIDLRKCFVESQNNFAKICDTIYHIWSYCKGNYWQTKDNEYYNSYKLLEKFGFNKQAVSRYKQCYEKFIHIPSCTVDAPFLGFSPSKLFELLSLSKETVLELIDKKLIVPEMTVKQIREFIKNIKNDSDKTKVIEDKTLDEQESELEYAFNPKQEYDVDYYNGKSKKELVSMCIQLQREIQSLLKSKKSKNVL